MHTCITNPIWYKNRPTENCSNEKLRSKRFIIEQSTQAFALMAAYNYTHKHDRRAKGGSKSSNVRERMRY